MDKIYETISKKHTIDHFLKCCEVTYIRGESRGTSNNVGEQKSKTKLKAIFALLQTYWTYLKSASV